MKGKHLANKHTRSVEQVLKQKAVNAGRDKTIQGEGGVNINSKHVTHSYSTQNQMCDYQPLDLA